MPVSHNFNIQSIGGGPSKVNPLILPRQGRGRGASSRTCTRLLPFSYSCSIHPWMKGYVGTFAHPYFAVTDADGNFEIKNAPAGDWRLLVWQEKVGWVIFKNKDNFRGKVIRSRPAPRPPTSGKIRHDRAQLLIAQDEPAPVVPSSGSGERPPLCPRTAVASGSQLRQSRVPDTLPVRLLLTNSPSLRGTPMRRFSLAFFSISFCVFLSSLLVLGCGSEEGTTLTTTTPRAAVEEETRDRPPSSPRPDPQEGRGGAKEYGTLSGKVTLDGDASAAIAELTASLKSAIDGNTDAARSASRGRSRASSRPSRSGRPLRDDRAGVPHRQEQGTGQRLRLDRAADRASTSTSPTTNSTRCLPKEVMISQPHCAFLPHCSVVFPSYYKDGKQELTGQKLVMENDALVLHNAKITSEKAQQPAGPRRSALVKPTRQAVSQRDVRLPPAEGAGHESPATCTSG